MFKGYDGGPCRLDVSPPGWLAWGQEARPTPHLSPSTMTGAEQWVLLRATAPHPREHLIFSLVLGTVLRLAEIVGLDVGIAFLPDVVPRVRVPLRPAIAKNGRAGDVFLPDALSPKVRRFWRYKLAQRERLAAEATLLCSHRWPRRSKRRVRVLFRAWRVIAGVDRLYPFHTLRHMVATNVCRASRDLFLAQRFARDAGPLTTIVSTRVSDEELLPRVGGLAR
jgi:integrase